MDPSMRSHSRFPVVMLKHGDDLRLRCFWIYRCGSLRYLTGIVFFHLIYNANSPLRMTKLVTPVLHVILSTNTVRDLM